MSNSIKPYIRLLEIPKILGINMAIALGYIMSSIHITELINPVFFWVLLGNALAAASSFIFNQIIEKDRDLLMDRTKDRPLPSKEISVLKASIVGILCFLSAFYILFEWVNSAAAMTTLFIFVIYVMMYTPLKTISRFNTFWGALSGFLLPFAGWFAFDPTFNWIPFFLGLTVFFWQHPHSHAISVLYAKDYEKGGFKMIPLFDADFKRTRYSILIHAFFLLPLSLAPLFFSRGGLIYSLVAMLASSLVLYRSVGFFRRPGEDSARNVLTSTLLYLPLLLVAAYLDIRF